MKTKKEVMMHHYSTIPELATAESAPDNKKIRFSKSRSCFARLTVMMLVMLGLVANKSLAQDTAITCAPRWATVGIAGFNAGGPSTYPSMAVNSTGEVFVAYRDGGTGGRISVSKYIGTGLTGWTSVGTTGFSDLGGVSYTNLAIDNSDSLWVAYKETGNGKVYVRKFDGTNWNIVGSSFSVGSAEFVTLDLNSSGVPYVAYRDGTNGRLSVKMLSSGSWVDVGPTYVTSASIHLTARISMEFDGTTPYVAYRETNGKLSVIKYTGSAWTSVGGVFTDSTDYPNLAMDGSTPYVIYMDMSASKKATVKKFDGTSWVTVGSAGFSPTVAMWNDIAINPSGQPVVVFKSDTSTSKNQSMVFDGTSWNYVANPFFSGAGADYNQIYIDASGNYWCTYADNLVAAKISVLKVTISVLEPIVGSNFVCTGNTAIFSNGTSGGAWSSSNTAAGTIGTTGVLSGTSVGVTNISYTLFSGCARGKTVSVNASPGTLSGGGSPFCAGTTVTITVPGGGTWVSSNPEIATVGSSSGIVTGVSGGTATITVTNAGGCSKSKVVTVNAAPTISEITGNLTVASSGITTLLSATPAGGTWTSGSGLVASVGSGTGIVTGGSTTGTAVISYRVTSGGCTGTVTAVVTNMTPGVGLIFDGTNDHISLPGGVSSASDFTFESWVRPASAVNDARLFDFGTSSTSDMYFTLRDATSTFPKFVINSGGVEQSVSGTAALANSTWTHLAVTLSGGVAKLYVNGVLAGTNSSFTFTPATIGSTATNNIGRSIAATNHINATLDEVRFWDVARTAEQIQANKNCDIAGQTGLLAAYRFNNGTASGTNTSNTVAVDYSGNNKCGTLNNFTLSGSTSNYVTGALGVCNTVTTPVFSVNPVAAVCAGQNVTVTTTGTGGTWSSSNTAAGTINASTGVFSGLAAGTSTVSYTVITNCIPTSFTTVVTVNAQPTAITGTLSVCEGGNVTLNSTPSSGSWVSSNTSVATVGTSGNVAGLISGTTLISYVHPTTGCPRVAEITVNPLPSAIGGTTTIDIAATTTLSATPAGGNWTSASTAIASTSGTTGVVTGNASGITTITYTSLAGCVRTTALTVNLAPISGPSTTCIGVPVTLTHPLSGGTWASGSTGVATIGSSSGIVTSISSGTTVITYSAVGLTRTYVISVVGTAPSISGTTTLCATSATTLSATPVSGSWTSSNASVAAVNDATGVVTGASAGTAVISYAIGSCYATAVVTVSAPLAAISGANTVCLGGSISLSHVTGSGSWTSSSTANATVNASTGVVSAVSVGSATITYATSPSCYVTTPVTVSPVPASISGTATVCEGLTTSLSHSVSGGTWSSNTTSVATISALGVVTGVAAGTSTVSYFTSEGCFTTKVVTVTALPATPVGTASVCVGSTTTLTGVGGGTWSSENTGVATIGSSTGIVTGASAGTANIVFTHTTTGCSVGRVVTVNALPTAITGSLSVCVGSISTLGSTPSGGTWVSASTGIATIDGTSGAVTGVAAGTSDITYTSTLGCRRTAIATVTALPAAITGTLSLCVGSSTTLTSATASQTWSSSHPGIATITAGSSTTGLVVAVSEGTATISYTNGSGCSRTVVVTVTSAPAAIAGDDVVCIGGVITLTNSTTGGSWISSTPARATANAVTGSVSGVSTGTVTITYSLGATCMVTKIITVNSAPAAISGTGSVCIGRTLTLSHAVPSGTWSTASANISIGTSSGIVTGVSAGTALVTYNTSSGCFVVGVVTVNSAPTAITGTASVCEGATTTLSGSGTGTWASESGTIATVGLSNGIVTGVAAGTTNITFTLSASGCSTTRVVTVLAQPAAISGSSSVCVSNTATLSSATTGGTWASASPSVASIASDGTVTGVSAGSSTITYTLASGCKITRGITVNASPAAISGSLGLCVGSTTTLSSATAGQTWSSTTPSVASIGASTGLVTASTIGTTTISYTNSFGCAQTAVVTVSSAATDITGNGEVCIGSSTVLSNVTSGGTWQSGNTSRATVNSVTGSVTGVSAGTVVITYQVGSGCYTTKVVTVSSSPADPITGPSIVCVGASISLSHPVAGGTWTTSNPSRATVNATTGSVSGVSSGTLTISYYTNAGCFRTYNVTVNALPNSIGGSNVVCEGATTTLTNSTPGGTWVNDGSFCTVGNTTGIVTGVGAGVGTVSYIVTATGCAITRDVTVNPQPSAISGTASVCVGSTSALSSSPTGGTWVSSVISRASVGMTSGVLGGVAAGTSVITYALPNGCRTTTVATVTAVPGSLTGTTSMCVGGSTTLTASVAGLTWSSSDPLVATVTTGSSVTGVVTGVATGTATISYASPSGCAATKVVTVTASGAPIAGASLVCVGGTISLTNGTGTWTSSNSGIATVSSAGIVTGIAAGPVTITFRSSATCFVTKPITVTTSPADAITGPTSVCQAATITLSHPVAGGTWSSSLPTRGSVDASTGVVTGISAGSVTISYTTQPGCFRTYIVNVAAFVYPISGTYTVCAGATTTLSSAVSGGVWSSSNTAVATINASNGLLTGVSGGTSTVTYQISSTGCNTVKTVSVNELPSAITGASAICIGESTTFTSSPALGTWSTSAGVVATVNASTGVVTGVGAGSVYISYRSPLGCVARSATPLIVNPLPLAITGNAVIAYGASRTLTSLTPGGVWSSSAPGVATVSAGGVVTAGLADGNTTISYTLATGCARTRIVTVNATGTRFAVTDPESTFGDVRVYPSPTTGVLTIETGSNGRFSVFSIDGKLIEQYQLNQTISTISLPSTLANGIYMCRFEGEDGTLKIFRVVYSR